MVFKKVKHKLGFLIFVFLFFGVLYTLLQTSSVQTWLVNKIGHSLSEKLNAKLSIQKVDVDFLNRLVLKGVMVEDRNKDTLLYAGELKANVNDWFIFKNRVEVSNVQLCDAVINLNRTDSVWNYQFLIDFFSSGESKKSGKNNRKSKGTHPGCAQARTQTAETKDRWLQRSEEWHWQWGYGRQWIQIPGQ